MPYFSFALNKNFNLMDLSKIITYPSEIKKNIKYFSKNTLLWKMLNNKKLINNVKFVKFEKRKKVCEIKSKILFCLPPSIGLGDAVEYALSIKAIIEQTNYDKFGVAFVGRYHKIFTKYFGIKDLYKEVIKR